MSPFSGFVCIVAGGLVGKIISFSVSVSICGAQAVKEERIKADAKNVFIFFIFGGLNVRVFYRVVVFSTILFLHYFMCVFCLYVDLIEKP